MRFCVNVKNGPISILGAGPAGLSAAIRLSKSGREVHIHERYEDTGRRFKGDLQGLENWTTKKNVLEELHSFGVDINFEANPFHEVTMTDGKTVFTRKSKKPLFYLVKRGSLPNSLDSGLYQQAKELGVHFHFKSTLNHKDAHIIATGPIRQALIASDKGVVFSTSLPDMAVAFFHDELAYLGYSYLLVSKGYGCLCTVVFHDFHRLNHCFEKTVELAKKLYPINLDDAIPVGGIGSFSLNHPKMEGSSLLVGEAAGFQDLLWGFGIRLAISTGHLAAQSLINDNNYSEQTEKILGGQMKAGVVNRYLWEKIKFRQIPILPFLFRFPYSLQKDFRFLYNFSFLHRFIYPLAVRYVKKKYPNSIDFVEEKI